jgi:hypothetical protein
MRGCRFSRVGSTAATWALPALGQRVDALEPICEANPRTSSVLPPSESGRFELDEFLGASSAGRPTQADQDGGGLGERRARVVRQDRCLGTAKSAPHVEPTGGSLAMTAS